MGRGHLPFAGGAAQQPAGIMAAFAVMSGVWGELEKRRRPKPKAT
jgi:hypothetical protein